MEGAGITATCERDSSLQPTEHIVGEALRSRGEVCIRVKQREASYSKLEAAARDSPAASTRRCLYGRLLLQYHHHELLLLLLQRLDLVLQLLYVGLLFLGGGDIDRSGPHFLKLGWWQSRLDALGLIFMMTCLLFLNFFLLFFLSKHSLVYHALLLECTELQFELQICNLLLFLLVFLQNPVQLQLDHTVIELQLLILFDE